MTTQEQTALPVASVPSQRRFHSVTTLIDNGTPKRALMGWIGRTVAEAGVEYHDVVGTMIAAGDRDGAIRYLADSRFKASEKAAARGSMLHEVARLQALGAPLPAYDDEVKPYVDQFLRYLDDFQPEYKMVETAVYNESYEYAGTLDAIVRLEGADLVQDIKTNYKKPTEKNRPPYSEIALQMVAYARAELVALRPEVEREEDRNTRYYVYDDTIPVEPMPPVEGALALIVTPYDYILKPVLIDDEVWTAWLYVREAARWTLETSKRVIGPQIHPTKGE